MRLRTMAVLAAGLLIATAAYAVNTVARKASWPNSYQMLNGSPLHRFTLTPDNSTAESNLTAAGGTAVTYTLVGGERICLQAVGTDAYVEIIAAASVTASGAKGFTITAGNPLWTNCFTLLTSQLSVSALCTAAGPCLVKGFEVR